MLCGGRTHRRGIKYQQMSNLKDRYVSDSQGKYIGLRVCGKGCIGPPAKHGTGHLFFGCNRLSALPKEISRANGEGGRELHLEPGRTEKVEVLIKQGHHSLAGLIIIIKMLAEEDVSYDIAGGTADDKCGVKGLT